MHKRIISLIIFFLLCGSLFAQPDILVRPATVNFNDVFSRFVPVTFINRGTQPALIDSITYRWYRYFIRFNKYSGYPLVINPGDSLKMDCIYSGYYYSSANDSLDTMKLYVRTIPNPVQVPLFIRSGWGEYETGTVTGTVTDTNNIPQANAKVYFIYENQGIFDSAITGVDGRYTRIIPKGKYRIAAKTQGSYLTFYGRATDPFRSPYITVRRDLTSSAPVSVIPQSGTGNSVSGTIVDSVTAAPVKKGVIVIRKGHHNPDKKLTAAGDETYTALLERNGSYSIPAVITPGYYFIQGFTDYFVPGYYTSSGKPAPLWQNADSVFISGTTTGKTIKVRRDSSYGAGSVSGTLTPASKFADAVLYAVNLQNGAYYSAAMVTTSGEFTVNNLPYGIYKLIIQTIYNNDIVSVPFTIDAQNTSLSNVSILYTGISETDITIPGLLTLRQNYPNPFNPSTVIHYSIHTPSEIVIRIFNTAGEVIAEHNAGVQSGEQQYEFNASAYNISSGVLVYEISAGKVSARRKMLLLK